MILSDYYNDGHDYGGHADWYGDSDLPDYGDGPGHCDPGPSMTAEAPQ